MTNHYNICFYGAGNVAYHLATILKNAGHNIVNVWSRNRDNALQLAQSVGAVVIETYDAFDDTTEIIFLCVPDDIIESAAKDLSHTLSTNTIVCHCSGSVSSLVLKNSFSLSGVFYPLQTLSKNKVMAASEIPILYTSNNPHTMVILEELSSHFSSLSRPFSDVQRANIHLPAVIVNNFTTALYQLAMEHCHAEDIPFALLFPLIKETSNKIVSGMNPMEALTGPARRNDQSTIHRHVQKLQNQPELEKIYYHITQYILSRYHENPAQF